MPTYRVYRVDGGGHVSDLPRIIDASDDAQAITQAALIASEAAVTEEECRFEVWDEARRVGVVGLRG